MNFRLSTRHYALAILLVWGAALLSFGLVRFDVVGITEGAAKDLILLWSIVDRVTSPAGTFGTPDFRTLLFLPVTMYWPGSIVAAKVFTMMMTFAAIYLLYSWSRKENGEEAALIASAVLLICPLTITQIDSIGTGVYLLLAFALGHWANDRYRAKGRHLGGWYFIQLLIVALAVSIHPAGLAYPLALAWLWQKNPVANEKDTIAPGKRKRSIFIGSALVTGLIVLFRWGWQDDVAWFNNPLATLSDAIRNGMSGAAEPANIAIGAVVITLLLVVLLRDRHALMKDFMATVLLFGLIIGLTTADATWAVIALTLLMYRGLPQLIAVNRSFRNQSLAGQRGLVIVAVFAVSTLFMMVDKGYARSISMGLLSSEDTLIQTLCQDVPEEAEINFKAASQWPARTMLSCRRDVFPLPQAQESGAALLENVKGITHLIFDHNDENNKALARNIAELAGVAETLSIQDGGVVIHLRGNTEHTIDQQPAQETEESTDKTS